MAEANPSSLTSVPLDEVVVGTVLGQDLSDNSGKVLLPAGTVLTKSLIQSLRRRDVLEIPLAPQEPLLSEEEWRVAAAQLRQRVSDMFCRAGESEVVGRLREAVFSYRISKLHGPAAIDDKEIR